jgi:flagellar motor switch protein FliG
MNHQGLNDAAILLMALGEETASEVFKHLNPKEVRKIGEAMARLKSTSRERVDGVLHKYKEAADKQSSLVGDTDEYVKAVLTRALGEEKAGLLIDRILHGSDVSGIESLKWMDAESVAQLIRNEHPQIIASILVHLERDHAASVMVKFSERLRNDVMMRIATLTGIQPTALRELNEVLSQVLAGGEKTKRTDLGGSKAAAEVLNFLGASIEANVLESIRENDPDLAQKIADQMFTFVDLLKLDDRSMQLVLREVSSDALVIALKSADVELKEKVLRNMSQRAAETLREDLESAAPVKVSEVENRQKEILKIVKRLIDEGQIQINNGGGGDDAYI